MRSVELNLPQRCAGHLFSKTDIDESVAIGKEAVRVAVEEGVSGDMMIFERASNDPYFCTVTHKKVANIANMVKRVPDEYINEEGKSTANEWANQCLFDYQGKKLPAFDVFKQTVL